MQVEITKWMLTGKMKEEMLISNIQFSIFNWRDLN